MARVRSVKQIQKPTAIVTFDFENSTYQIDPNLKKVYRRFVEIETSKAATILHFWRSQASLA